MKKNKTLYILLIVLSLLATYFVLTNKKTTIKKRLSDFAVSDTASITKVFLADKQNRTVLLERTPEGWKANQKYFCRKDAIDNLLTTIKDIQVKSPVPKAEFETDIKRLASNGIKVEIYTTNPNKPFKVYYVGGPTSDHQGTYMLLENSSEPFIMYLPGFFGYLTTRYFTEERLWRDNAIFKNPYDKIKYVKAEYPKSPEKGFIAYNMGNNKFALADINNNKIDKFDTLQVKMFIGGFQHLGYEAPITNMKTQKRDSLLNVLPENIYTVVRTDNSKISLKLYNVPLSKAEQDKYEQPLKYDPDRMYGFFNNDSDLVTVQTHLLYPLTKELKDFIK